MTQAMEIDESSHHQNHQQQQHHQHQHQHPMNNNNEVIKFPLHTIKTNSTTTFSSSESSQSQNNEEEDVIDHRSNTTIMGGVSYYDEEEDNPHHNDGDGDGDLNTPNNNDDDDPDHVETHVYHRSRSESYNSLLGSGNSTHKDSTNDNHDDNEDDNNSKHHTNTSILSSSVTANEKEDANLTTTFCDTTSSMDQSDTDGQDGMVEEEEEEETSDSPTIIRDNPHSILGHETQPMTCQEDEEDEETNLLLREREQHQVERITPLIITDSNPKDEQKIPHRIKATTTSTYPCGSSNPTSQDPPSHHSITNTTNVTTSSIVTTFNDATINNIVENIRNQLDEYSNTRSSSNCGERSQHLEEKEIITSPIQPSHAKTATIEVQDKQQQQLKDELASPSCTSQRNTAYYYAGLELVTEYEEKYLIRRPNDNDDDNENNDDDDDDQGECRNIDPSIPLTLSEYDDDDNNDVMSQSESLNNGPIWERRELSLLPLQFNDDDDDDDDDVSYGSLPSVTEEKTSSWNGNSSVVTGHGLTTLSKIVERGLHEGFLDDRDLSGHEEEDDDDNDDDEREQIVAQNSRKDDDSTYSQDDCQDTPPPPPLHDDDNYDVHDSDQKEIDHNKMDGLELTTGDLISESTKNENSLNRTSPKQQQQQQQHLHRQTNSNDSLDFAEIQRMEIEKFRRSLNTNSSSSQESIQSRPSTPIQDEFNNNDDDDLSEESYQDHKDTTPYESPSRMMNVQVEGAGDTFMKVHSSPRPTRISRMYPIQCARGGDDDDVDVDEVKTPQRLNTSPNIATHKNNNNDAWNKEAHSQTVSRRKAMQTMTWKSENWANSPTSIASDDDDDESDDEEKLERLVRNFQLANLKGERSFPLMKSALTVSESVMDIELEEQALEIQQELLIQEMEEVATEAERAAEAGDEKFVGCATRFGITPIQSAPKAALMKTDLDPLDEDVSAVFETPHKSNRARHVEKSELKSVSSMDLPSKSFNYLEKQRDMVKQDETDDLSSPPEVKRYSKTDIKKPQLLSQEKRNISAPPEIERSSRTLDLTPSNISTTLTMTASFLSPRQILSSAPVVPKISVMSLRNVEEVIPSFQEMQKNLNLNMIRYNAVAPKEEIEEKQEQNDAVEKTENLSQTSFSFLPRADSFQRLFASVSRKGGKNLFEDDSIYAEDTLDNSLLMPEEAVPSPECIDTIDDTIDCVSFVSCGGASREEIAQHVLMTPQRKEEFLQTNNSKEEPAQLGGRDIYICTLANEIHSPGKTPRGRVSPPPKAPYLEDMNEFVDDESLATPPRLPASKSRWALFWNQLSARKKGLLSNGSLTPPHDLQPTEHDDLDQETSQVNQHIISTDTKENVPPLSSPSRGPQHQDQDSQLYENGIEMEASAPSSNDRYLPASPILSETDQNAGSRIARTSTSRSGEDYLKRPPKSTLQMRSTSSEMSPPVLSLHQSLHSSLKESQDTQQISNCRYSKYQLGDNVTESQDKSVLSVSAMSNIQEEEQQNPDAPLTNDIYDNKTISSLSTDPVHINWVRDVMPQTDVEALSDKPPLHPAGVKLANILLHNKVYQRPNHEKSKSNAEQILPGDTIQEDKETVTKGLESREAHRRANWKNTAQDDANQFSSQFIPINSTSNDSDLSEIDLHKRYSSLTWESFNDANRSADDDMSWTKSFKPLQGIDDSFERPVQNSSSCCGEEKSMGDESSNCAGNSHRSTCKRTVVSSSGQSQKTDAATSSPSQRRRLPKFMNKVPSIIDRLSPLLGGGRSPIHDEFKEEKAKTDDVLFVKRYFYISNDSNLDMPIIPTLNDNTDSVSQDDYCDMSQCFSLACFNNVTEGSFVQAATSCDLANPPRWSSSYSQNVNSENDSLFRNRTVVEADGQIFHSPTLQRWKEGDAVCEGMKRHQINTIQNNHSMQENEAWQGTEESFGTFHTALSVEE